MDRDRIRIFLMVACTGMRMNRHHKDVNRVSEVPCFALRNTDFRTTGIWWAVEMV